MKVEECWELLQCVGKEFESLHQRLVDVEESREEIASSAEHLCSSPLPQHLSMSTIVQHVDKPVPQYIPQNTVVSLDELDLEEIGVSELATVDMLWPIWRERNFEVLSSLSCISACEKTLYYSPGMGGTKYGETFKEKGYWQSLVRRPTSMAALLWDVLSLIALAYDVLNVPLLAFQMPKTTTQTILNCITMIFWTVDIAFSMTLGFDKGGVVEMRPKMIVRRYVRSWFCVDLLTVGIDWLMFIEDNENLGPLGTLRFLKSFKIMRALRAIRFFKLARRLSALSWIADHKMLSGEIGGVVNFLIVILVLVHYLACGWYALGKYGESSTTHTWVQEFTLENPYPDALLTRNFYLVCLHWSLCQFTPAGMEIHARTPAERLYTIVVIMLGMVLFSSFISGITAAMTSLRQSTITRTRQIKDVRAYIREKRLSVDLGIRMVRFLKRQDDSKKTRLMEHEVTALHRLSQSLLREFHIEIYLPVIIVHPFFHQFQMADPRCIAWICHQAASEIAIAEKEKLIRYGEEATSMSFLVSDSVECLWARSQRVSGKSTTSHMTSATKDHHSLTKGDDICEVALWLCWKFYSVLQVESACEMVKINASRFHHAVRMSNVRENCHSYAHAFAKEFLANTEALSLGFDQQQEIAQTSFIVELHDIHAITATKRAPRQRGNIFSWSMTFLHIGRN